MGVKGLKNGFGITSNDRQSCIKDVRGKTLAIDSMIWLVQFITSKMEIVDKFYVGYDIDFNTELANFLDFKFGMFIEMNCSLIFVIDGDRNPLKFEENTARQKKVADARLALDQLILNHQEADLNVVHKLMKESISVSPAVVSSLKAYCDSRNYVMISAPYECDPMLISLQLSDIAYGIVTTDQDLIALGGENIIYDIDYSGWSLYLKQKHNGQIPDQQKLKLDGIKCNIISFSKCIEILNGPGTGGTYNHFSFLVYCNLLGTDFQRHGISKKKADSIMCKFFEKSITPETLKSFTDSINSLLGPNFITFSGEELVSAVNAFAHPIVFHITKESYNQKAYKSANSNCVSLRLLSDIRIDTSPSSSGRRTTTESLSTSGRTALETRMRDRLGFSIFDVNSTFYSTKLAIANNYISYFTVSRWIRTDNKLPVVTYSKTHPKDTMINFDTFPSRFFTVETLRKYLSARGISDPASISHQQVVVNVEKLRRFEAELGKCLISDRYLEKTFSQYDNVNSLIRSIDHSATKYFSNPSHHDNINSIIRYVFPPVTDKLFDDAMLKHNRPAVKDRAERLLKQGYLVSSDMKVVKAQVLVSGGLKWVFILEGVAYASMEKEEHHIQIVVCIKTKELLLTPISNCTCMVGRLFCSHQIATFMFIYQIQLYGLQHVLQQLPQGIRRLDKLAVPLELYTRSLYSWQVDRNKDSALVYDEIKQLQGGVDQDEDEGESKTDGSEARGEIDDIFAPTEEHKGRRYVSCVAVATKVIQELQFQSDRKDDDSRKRKRVSRQIDLSTLNECHYSLYYAGPSESRSNKIHQFETLELLDKEYHVKKTLRLCLLSHFLEYTREYRKRVLDNLRSNVSMIYLKFGTGKIPPGWCILADRGFRRDASKFPNMNPVIYPTLVSSRSQFEVEEVIEDIDLCKLRYTSEIVFSRTTDCHLLQGIIPVCNLPYITHHLNYAYGRANLMQPLACPENWSDYICKYHESMSVYNEKFPSRNSKKRESSVKENIRSKSKVPFHTKIAKEIRNVNSK